MLWQPPQDTQAWRLPLFLPGMVVVSWCKTAASIPGRKMGKEREEKEKKLRTFILTDRPCYQSLLHVAGPWHPVFGQIRCCYGGFMCAGVHMCAWD